MTWAHEVSRQGYHFLGPTQSCRCEARHTCISCQDDGMLVAEEQERLRTVNAKLLSTLAGLATDAETFLDAADDRRERMRYRENLMGAVRVARDAIEEARK